MIFLIVKIVWGHHKFPTQINDLYLCKKYLYTWKKKYTQKQKKNLQNCAHQGYVLQHTETFKLVSFLQKYRHISTILRWTLALWVSVSPLQL